MTAVDLTGLAGRCFLAMNAPERRPSAIRNVGVLALVVAAAYFLPNLLNRVTDALFFPWVHAEPPLLDQWVGQLAAGNGVPLGVTMRLERELTDRETICMRCNQIEGSATTCDPRGTVLRYRISGSPKDRQGRQLHLGAVPVPQPPPDGLELDVLVGTWDGADALELQADFHWRRGGSAISSTDDPATQPVPIRMERKGQSAFEALCATLR